MKNQILILDDDVDIGRVVKRKLAADNYVVTALTTSQELISAIQERKPCLVILDKHLPGENGLDILKQIRALNPELPVAILTGDADWGDALLACQCGACDFMMKPIDWEHLRNLAYFYSFLNETDDVSEAH